MMLQPGKKFVAWLLKYEAISKEDVEMYEYVMKVFLITIFPLIIVAILGLIIGSFLNFILLIIPFLTIRKFSGGIHARRAFTCFIISTIVLIACMYFTISLKPGIGLHFILMLSILSILFFSPVDSENRKLNVEEKKRYGRITAFLVITYGAVYWLLIFLNGDRCAVCFANGIILASLCQLPCVHYCWPKQKL